MPTDFQSNSNSGIVVTGDDLSLTSSGGCKRATSVNQLGVFKAEQILGDSWKAKFKFIGNILFGNLFLLIDQVIYALSCDRIWRSVHNSLALFLKLFL